MKGVRHGEHDVYMCAARVNTGTPCVDVSSAHVLLLCYPHLACSCPGSAARPTAPSTAQRSAVSADRAATPSAPPFSSPPDLRVAAVRLCSLLSILAIELCMFQGPHPLLATKPT